MGSRSSGYAVVSGSCSRWQSHDANSMRSLMSSFMALAWSAKVFAACSVAIEPSLKDKRSTMVSGSLGGAPRSIIIAGGEHEFAVCGLMFCSGRTDMFGEGCLLESLLAMTAPVRGDWLTERRRLREVDATLVSSSCVSFSGKVCSSACSWMSRLDSIVHGRERKKIDSSWKLAASENKSISNVPYVIF